MSGVSILKIMLCYLLIVISGCMPASSSEPLPESDHPYANNFEKTWNISEPSASQIRLHFTHLEFPGNDGLDNDWDKVIILDKYDHELATYGEPYSINRQNIWTDWYTEDTLKVKFVTDASLTGYGFKVDKVETRSDPNASNDSSAEASSLAESNHPYANNFEKAWTIPNPSAGQIRLHFKYLEFPGNDGLDNDWDKVIILDKYDHKLATYGEPYNIDRQNIWTDWYTEDTLKVKFVTDASLTDYGFVIDKLETRLDEPNSSSENIGNSKSPVSEVQPDAIRTGGNKILTSTELISSANLSTLGQSVTLVAKVNIPSEEIEEPLGTVTFMDGTTSIGVADLISGQAMLTTSSLSVGLHSITAEYSGDSNFKSSTSSPFTLTVKEQTNTGMVKSSSENQFSSEQLTSSDEKSSTEQNSAVKGILTLISENPLISTIVGGIIVAIITKKPPKNEKGQS